MATEQTPEAVAEATARIRQQLTTEHRRAIAASLGSLPAYLTGPIAAELAAYHAAADRLANVGMDLELIDAHKQAEQNERVAAERAGRKVKAATDWDLRRSVLEADRREAAAALNTARRAAVDAVVANGAALAAALAPVEEAQHAAAMTALESARTALTALLGTARVHATVLGTPYGGHPALLPADSLRPHSMPSVTASFASLLATLNDVAEFTGAAERRQPLTSRIAELESRMFSMRTGLERDAVVDEHGALVRQLAEGGL